MMIAMVVEHGHLRLELNDAWCSEASAVAADQDATIVWWVSLLL
jgi:hypothetical protein